MDGFPLLLLVAVRSTASFDRFTVTTTRSRPLLCRKQDISNNSNNSNNSSNNNSSNSSNNSKVIELSSFSNWPQRQRQEQQRLTSCSSTEKFNGEVDLDLVWPRSQQIGIAIIAAAATTTTTVPSTATTATTATSKSLDFGH